MRHPNALSAAPRPVLLPGGRNRTFECTLTKEVQIAAGRPLNRPRWVPGPRRSFGARAQAGELYDNGIVSLRPNAGEIRGDVANFLKRNLGVAYCDDCIRYTLHFSRNQAPEQLLSRTASQEGLQRQHDDCSMCRVRRTITRAV